MATKRVKLTAKQRKNQKRESIKDVVTVGLGLGAVGAYSSAPYHNKWVRQTRAGFAKGKHTMKYTRPAFANGGIGVSRASRDHFSSSTHSLKFHKSAKHIHQASSTPSFSNYGFHSNLHTTHSLSAPMVGGAALLGVGAVAGGAYYYRKRKNGKMQRVKKGKRK